jgi:selenocysteine lyase/cysteine desulfurase
VSLCVFRAPPLEPLWNLVANGFTSILKPGDEVLISALEHHSNIIALANAL